MTPRPTTEPGVVLDTLADADCRSILVATGDRPLTVAELETTSGLPRSTLYRKIETLADTGLLDERVRMREQGHHPSTYVRRVAAVETRFADDGVRVELVPDDPASESARTAEHSDPPALRPARVVLPVGAAPTPNTVRGGGFDGSSD
jgi:DNA-binding transcriptional ArsR family regulator